MTIVEKQFGRRTAVSPNTGQTLPGKFSQNIRRDPRDRGNEATQFVDNWEQLKHILEGRHSAATHRELPEDWPPDGERPGATQFYAWLNLATAMGRVERKGNGTRLNPWKYSLKRPDDMADLPELPPLFGYKRKR